MGTGLKYLKAVSDLMEDTLAEDPVDLGMLPIDEENAKQLIITSMCEHWDTMVGNSSTQDELAVTALTIMSKLAYENFVLHLQLQKMQ